MRRNPRTSGSFFFSSVRLDCSRSLTLYILAYILLEDEEDDRPACFGELEFLGLSAVRKMAVKALTPCVCRLGGPGWIRGRAHACHAKHTRATLPRPRFPTPATQDARNKTTA